MFVRYYVDFENMVSTQIRKVQFRPESMEFWGYVVSSDGISMDPMKVQAILDWQAPLSVRNVQCFLGFANFYQKFIKNYSKVVVPLTQLTHKNQPFIWSSDAAEAFESLKRAFTTAPIFARRWPGGLTSFFLSISPYNLIYFLILCLHQNKSLTNSHEREGDEVPYTAR